MCHFGLFELTMKIRATNDALKLSKNRFFLTLHETKLAKMDVLQYYITKAQTTSYPSIYIYAEWRFIKCVILLQ